MRQGKRKLFIKRVIEYRELLFMLLPAILFFTIFSYLPMLGIGIAFQRYTFDGGIFHSPWVWFDNFKFMFLSGDIFNVTKNTLVFNILFILVNNFIEIICAIILAEISNKHFKRITQSMMFLPYFISWVVIGAFAYNVLNFESGSFNTLMKALHLAPFDFYNTPKIWILIIVLVCAWKNIGYGTIIYLSAVMGIDGSMYESAEIDGANIFQRIRHITLPSLTPTIVILILLSMGSIFRGDFSMFYQVTGNNAMLYSTTDVIDTYVTRSLVSSSEFGMTAAAGLYQSVLCFAIIMIFNALVKRYDKDYSLF
ncbi:MAG: sugar transporter permease [Herbinix sp.]|jgi:putative aldouronate transport system permease protein|nr:sugar transporter permease [Herbinix sp.]